MYHKALIGGVTAAAIVCAGGTALAVSGSDGSTGTSATTTATTAAAPTAAHPRLLARANRLLHRLAHGELVVRGKDGFVTRDLIAGTVTAVSATSITVQAADKTSETFVVTKDTKVRVRSNGSGSASTIDQVASGDSVLVVGTGTSTKTAKRVLDVKQ
jgi:hypothetical protein